MKRIRKLMVCLIIMAMTLSVTTPVFASQSSELSEWKSFPNQSSGNYSSAYTKAVQRFLYDYNSSTRAILADAGGLRWIDNPVSRLCCS